MLKWLSNDDIVSRMIKCWYYRMIIVWNLSIWFMKDHARLMKLVNGWFDRNVVIAMLLCYGNVSNLTWSRMRKWDFYKYEKLPYWGG